MSIHTYAHALFFLRFIYVYEYCAWMHICAPHPCNAGGGQKRALDRGELELQGVVSYCVDAGDQAQGSGRVDSAFNH